MSVIGPSGTGSIEDPSPDRRATHKRWGRNEREESELESLRENSPDSPECLRLEAENLRRAQQDPYGTDKFRREQSRKAAERHRRETGQ